MVENNWVWISLDRDLVKWNEECLKEYFFFRIVEIFIVIGNYCYNYYSSGSICYYNIIKYIE